MATDRRAIRWAVESGDVSRVRAALAEQTEGVDSHGLGLLLGIAVERGKLSVARALIQEGADVNAFRERPASGVSPARAGGNADFTEEPFAPPLFTAVDTGAVDGVRLLLESGADVNLRLPEAGTTALDSAAGRGNQTMMAYLHQQGAQIGPRTLAVAIRGTRAFGRGARVAAVRWLLDHGATLESSERTLLGEAIDQADPDLVRMLLERGEDFLWVNAAGQTALQWAEDLHARGESAGTTDTDMMHRRSEVLRILREHDATRLGLERIDEPPFLSSWLDSMSAWFDARRRLPVLIIGVAIGIIGLVWLLSDHQPADRRDTSASQRHASDLAAREEIDFLQFLRSDLRRRGIDGRVRAYAVPDVAGTLRVAREAMRDRFADLCARVEHGLPREMCPFIEVRQCVGEGCFVDGIRRAGAPFDLFSAPGAAVRQRTAVSGQPFLAETTWIFTVPCRAHVEAAEPHYSDLRVGERVYALSYAGEGTFRYLTQRGQRNSALDDQVQHTDCPEYRDRSESWTRLRAADGRTGWARVSDELQGTSTHEPPILDDNWPETLPASFDPFAAKGPLCSYLDRPFDGTEIALLFEDSLLRGQTASGKPWHILLGPLKGDTGSTFVNVGGRANENGRYQVERDRICLNPGGTNEWHCFGVVRCYERSMMGREGFVLTDADEEQIAIVLEYEMGISHRLWAD